MSNFSKSIKPAMILILAATVLGILYNLVSPKGIGLVGSWSPQILEGNIIVPPSYDKTSDSPPISMADAMSLYNTPSTIFIDARPKEDYVKGHIKGALNLYLEEYDTWAPKVLPNVPKEVTIVTYCGADECELSLFLARNMTYDGYKNIKIFFGGWEEWLKAGLPTSVGENP
jgi:rhodanese-related sulfurtransferase